MDEAEQDQYEARLKELFDSFDSTGTGSLGQEELTDLCHVLHLEEVAPALQQTLLQDNLLGRVRPGWAPVLSAPWALSPWQSCLVLSCLDSSFPSKRSFHKANWFLQGTNPPFPCSPRGCSPSPDGGVEAGADPGGFPTFAFPAWLFAPIPEISRAARPPQAPATWMLLSAFVAHAHPVPATSSTPSGCSGCAGDPKEDFFPSLCLQGWLVLTTLP